MIDVDGTLLIYVVGCILGAIFVLFFVKETKGKSMLTDDNNSSNDKN